MFVHAARETEIGGMPSVFGALRVARLEPCAECMHVEAVAKFAFDRFVVAAQGF